MEVKVYGSGRAKVMDFLAGFFLVGGGLEYGMRYVLTAAGYSLLVPVLIVASVVFWALAAYLLKKRRYMGLGLGAVLVLHVVAVSPYLLVLAVR